MLEAPCAHLSVFSCKKASKTNSLTLVVVEGFGARFYRLHAYANSQFYMYICTYVRRYGSLYLVGIRPLALVLITLPCLLRPCNLPPLKCGFEKKRLNPLALIVSTLSFSQPPLKVSVPVAPPCPHMGPLPPIAAGRPPFSQLRC